MVPEAISMQIVAGGLLGTIGQGVRVVAGLKKAHDAASLQGQALNIETGTLLISLFIGFTAGALALLVAGGFNPLLDIDKSTASALIASGYAGTDFIEAFMKKYLPADSSSPSVVTDAVVSPAQAAPASTPNQDPPAVG